jgi:hypothetical protein
MSRFYNMRVEISGHDASKTEAIKDAATGEWEFDDWNEYEGKLSANAHSYLCGGETEKQFAERVSVAVWKVNGKFCDVAIHATCLEYLPCETYALDEDDFDRLKAESEKPGRLLDETPELQG